MQNEFAYIELTREKFPRIGFARKMNTAEAVYFRPIRIGIRT